MVTRVVAAAAAAVLAAGAVWWHSTTPPEVNAVVTNVRCAWAPLRLGDVIVTGRVANPSLRGRDFELAVRVSLPRLGPQAQDGASLRVGARRSQRFWVDVPTSPRSHPGGRITGCGADARSFTPSGDD